jgi:hypothetical protein
VFGLSCRIAKLRTRPEVRQHFLVREIAVLIGVDPDVIGALIPEHSEQTARAFRVAVAVQVFLKPVARDRIEYGFVQEMNTKRASRGAV